MSKRLLFLFILAVACQKEAAPPPGPPMKEGAPPMPMTTSPTATAASQPQKLTGFETPESVLYDPDQDVYFVSNINGQPTAADDNGFISRINPETLQVDLKWIDAAKPDIILNAPKGMAILGDDLYVNDLVVVRRFDRKTGKPKGEIAIPGSTFLNDLASDGKALYVTDSGLKAGANGFEPTGTDAVWKIVNGKPQKLASGSDLNRPNGVEIADGKVWVVTFGANELYQIDKGKKTNVSKLPAGSLDGLVHMSDGTFLVSSWDSKSVYRGKPGGTFVTVVDDVTSPADIGYDTKRHRLLIPHFMENVVTIHSLQ
jgi:hypothetical protein